MNKIAKNIIGWVLYVALLAVLVFGVPKGLAYVLKTNYPMASITSGSMWPELKKGDLVLIKGISSKEQIQIGDVVVYKNEKGFTIHRVIKMNEETLVTKGDANNVEDAAIAYNEVIGRTLNLNNKPLRIPALGFISVFLNRNKI